MYSIQTQVSRLRIGHTGLNKSKTFMSKHPTGLSDWCGGGETLEHVSVTRGVSGVKIQMQL